jgi:hypothetical protein
MGRPERPLDPMSGPLPSFASQLRRLREEAGRPTYRAMAAVTNYSAAALSRAAAGERLPTLDATLAFVRACGGDEAEWQSRWHQAHDAVTPARPEAAVRPEARGSGASGRLLTPPRRGRLKRLAAGLWRNRLLALLAVAVAALLVNLGFTVQTAPHSDQPRSPADSAARSTGLSPVDGADPYISRCGIDQVRIERRTWPIYWPGGKVYGHLILFHSDSCHANWGYVYGPNSPKWTVVIITRRLQEDLASAPSSFRGDAPPNSWGNLLSDRTGCVRAEAYVITASGRGPTAVTSCWQESGPVYHSS